MGAVQTYIEKVLNTIHTFLSLHLVFTYFMSKNTQTRAHKANWNPNSNLSLLFIWGFGWLYINTKCVRIQLCVVYLVFWCRRVCKMMKNHHNPQQPITRLKLLHSVRRGHVSAHIHLSFSPNHYTNCLDRASSIWEIARASKPLVLKYYNVIHHTCIYTICILHDNYCTRLTQNPIQHWESHPCYLSYRTICYNTRWCQGIYLHPEPQSPILRPHINKALTFRINLNYKFRNLSSLEI